VFDAEFPDAEHVAIGLPAKPRVEPWAAHGLAVESEVVMLCDEPCEPAPLAEGYAVRRLVTADDWGQLVAADEADNRATGEFAEDAYRAFAARAAAVRAEMVRRGVAAFFGACTSDGTLVARLGIVLCGSSDGTVGRFQHVGTVPEHRGRGLASHMLAEAARWAEHEGAQSWEIHADPASAGERLYLQRGFAPAGRTWQAHRADRT
jgi:GNAT superfamily N-acetyltransferase